MDSVFQSIDFIPMARCNIIEEVPCGRTMFTSWHLGSSNRKRLRKNSPFKSWTWDLLPTTRTHLLLKATSEQCHPTRSLQGIYPLTKLKCPQSSHCPVNGFTRLGPGFNHRLLLETLPIQAETNTE